MAQIITIDNFPRFNLTEVAELKSDVAAGATALPITTETAFDTSHAVLVGVPGDETSEITIPSAVADDSLTVPAIDNAHTKGTKIYELRGHKARIYRALKIDGACPLDDASYTLIATVTLQADSLETEYDDASGSDDYCYVYTFYDDIPLIPLETALDPMDAVIGGNGGYSVTVDEVRDEAGFNDNPYISDALIMSKIRLAQGEANSAAIIGGYSLPVVDDEGVFKNAVLLLAAGYLMTKDYGLGSNGINKEGADKLAQGKALLKQIESGELTLVGVEVVGERRKGITGYPMDIDVDPDDNPWFTRDDKF